MKISARKLMAWLLKRPVIIESGTEGIWTWRKWSDGTAECWGEERKSTVVATSWGNGYLSPQLRTNLPAGLFTGVPIITMFVTGAYTAIVANSSARQTKDSIKYSFFRPSALSSGQDFYVSIRAIGKWGGTT